MQVAVCEDDRQGFVLKNKHGIVRIEFACLVYVEVINKVVSFHLTGGRTQEVKAALANFEDILLSRLEFLKVHRSYLVNLNHVQTVSGGEIVTDSGETVPVARKRRIQVQDTYMRFLLEQEEASAGGAGARHCPEQSY